MHDWRSWVYGRIDSFRSLYTDNYRRIGELARLYALSGERELYMDAEARLLRESPGNGYVLFDLVSSRAVLGDKQRAVELALGEGRLCGVQFQVEGAVKVELVGRLVHVADAGAHFPIEQGSAGVNVEDVLDVLGLGKKECEAGEHEVRGTGKWNSALRRDKASYPVSGSA